MVIYFRCIIVKKIKSKSKLKQAVFPVAGLGSRFLPVTKSIPKEMLPIIDKPLIQFAVEEAIEAGIEEIIFVTSHTKKAIEDYFSMNYELEHRLKAVSYTHLTLPTNREV